MYAKKLKTAKLLAQRNFDFNELLMNGIPIMPQFDLLHSSSMRKRIRWTLNHTKEKWTDDEIKELMEYFKTRLFSETKEIVRYRNKNMELKFTVLQPSLPSSFQSDLIQNSGFFNDMDVELMNRCVIYRKLVDLNNEANTYQMQDLNWLNFGDFIFNLVQTSQKPLIAHRGIFDLLNVIS
jgi:hypothetical protein